MGSGNKEFLPWISRVDFPTTKLWTKLEQDVLTPEIWQEVLARYGSPVYSNLRAMGFGPDEADDLTVSFFSEKVFAGHLLENIKRRGSFRGYLRQALRHYVIDVFRKRHPKRRVVALDIEAAIPAAPILNPELRCIHDEAKAFVTTVLDKLREECFDRGLHLHWELFEARVLGPTFYGEAPVPLPELCARLNIATPQDAANMIPAVKRRFRTVLKREIERRYSHEANAEEKLKELCELFATAERCSPHSTASHIER